MDHRSTPSPPSGGFFWLIKTGDMDMLEGLLAAFGIKQSSVLAGFLGGLCSLPFLQGRSLMQKILSVFCGTVCAAYLTPLVAGWFGLDASGNNVAAMVCGIVGINLVGGIFALGEQFRADPSRIFKK